MLKNSFEIESFISFTFKIFPSHQSTCFFIFGEIIGSVFVQTGDLKWVLAPLTNLEPKKQSLFFRDQEREDSVHLHLAGVGENSMILLLDPVSKERKRQNDKEAKRHPSILAYKKEEKTNKPKQV